MIVQRKSGDRGRTEIGWLDSHHTFSFGDYRDPAHMGFGPLRVINEDKVAPGAGFPNHPHQNMEIITVVLSGALEHRDSLGNGSTLHPGEVQCMSAGTGIRHSEMNPDRARPVHFVQIWIVPEQAGVKPSYGQRAFTARRKPGALTLVASRDARDESLSIHQDVDLYVADVMPASRTALGLRPGRAAWVQVTRGNLLVNGTRLEVGDGAAITDEKMLELSGDEPAEALVFDLPWRSNG